MPIDASGPEPLTGRDLQRMAVGAVRSEPVSARSLICRENTGIFTKLEGTLGHPYR